VIVALGAGIVACVSFLPTHRLKAFFWHVRHGVSVEVGRYRFPVPKQWYLRHDGTEDIDLIDLDNGDSILLSGSGMPYRTLATWSQMIRNNRTITVTAQRELHIGDETVLCFEEDLYLPRRKVHLYPIQCRSDGALLVAFAPDFPSGKNHNEMFYSLLQQTVIGR
jgi:hypothetical protein